MTAGKHPSGSQTGNLPGIRKRFPDGILALARYVHSKGLKFGLYATPEVADAPIWDDYPGKTGSIGHEYQDARTFARWGVDYLKYDWCKADEDGLTGESAFGLMRDAIQGHRPPPWSIRSTTNPNFRFGTGTRKSPTCGAPRETSMTTGFHCRISLMTIPIAHHSSPRCLE